MTIRIVGAGLPRTATHSLRVALGQLLNEPCYHMLEVFDRPQDVPVWHAAVRGEMPDWGTFLGDYGAAVDWPVSAFWPELAEAFPEAPVILSTRDSAATWYRSAANTVLPAIRRERGEPSEVVWRDMVLDLMRTRFADPWSSEAGFLEAYERHNARVRATIGSDRLIEWQASLGWEPLCAALGVSVPVEPFPVTNTTEEWLARNEEESA